MPTFICSNGDDFLVQQEDRGYKGVNTNALKIDGKTGVVTVAGQTISSSGVIGATGAVTATNVAASGTLDVTGVSTLGVAHIVGNSTVVGTLGVTGNTAVTGTFGVTGTSTLTGNLVVTGTGTVGGKTIATGALRSVVSVGVDASGGAADVTMASTVAGDKLVAAFNATDNTDVQADFESTVSVSGKLNQLTTDLSAKTILFIFNRP
jgi:hypothetical protein